jgi:hypothetical protein
MSGTLSLGATYSRPKGGASPPPWSTRPSPSLLAALFSHILMQRGPSLLALEKRCVESPVVRPCLPPVGQAQDFG